MTTRLDYSPQGGRQFESIDKAIKNQGSSGIGGGIRVEVNLTTAAQDISHGLGKPYTGWFFIGKSAATDAFEGTSPDPSRYLRLTGTVATTVVLWVF